MIGIKLIGLYWMFFSLSLRCHAEKTYEIRNIQSLDPSLKDNFNIKIGVLLPKHTKTHCSLRNVLPAIEVAVDFVRHDLKLFRSANFSIVYSDSNSNLSEGPLKAIDIFNDKMANVMLGPLDSFILANVVRYSSYRYKVPIVSAEGFASDLGNKKIYPMLTRLAGTYKDISNVFDHIFKQFNWLPRGHNTVAIWYIWHKIHDYECNFQTKPIMDRFKQNGLKYIDINDELSVMNDALFHERIGPNLNRIKKNVRLTIICTKNTSYVRHIMLSAHKMGLTNGEFVFFNIDLSASQVKGKKPWFAPENSPEINQNAKEAYRSIITISFRLPDTKQYKDFTEKVKQKSEIFYKYAYGAEDANSCVGLFHDAVLLYCLALNDTLRDGHRTADGEYVTRKMWNRTLLGITGEVWIDKNGDGYSDYSLLDMDKETGDFSVVGTFLGKNNSLFMNENKVIDWANSKNAPPPDTPECGFDNSGCPPISPWLAAVITILFVMVLSVIIVYVYIKKKLKLELNSMDWLIPWDVIDTQEKRQRQRSLNSTVRKNLLPEDIKSNHTKHLYGNSKYKTAHIKDGGQELKMLLKEPTENRNSISNISHKSNESSSSLLTLAGIQISQLAATQMFAKTAIYKNNIVALKHIHLQPGRKIEITQDIKVEVKSVKDLNNNHVARFIGICLDPGNEYILTEYCSRGSLQDVLEDEKIKLDWMFRLSLMQDLCRGMIYLHTTIGFHGNLKSSNCLVDSRFVLKITDFGLATFRRINIELCNHDSFQFYKNKLWTAPEVLRNPALGPVGLAKADVYSFSIVAQEISYRSGVFFISDVDIISPDVVVDRVRRGETPPARPRLELEHGIQPDIISIIRSCWSEDPNMRPSFLQIKLRLRRLNWAGDGDILDNLLSRMEQYANNLEGLVAQRTQQYYDEKRKAEDLLYSMLPKSVAGQLIRGEPVTAESFDSVTIYFSDICGFTALSASSTPMEVITLLNNLYTLFDSILENYDVYKVETIGDAYMVVSGLPQRNGIIHAKEIASMTIAFLSEIYKFKIPHMPDQQLKIRIGIHTGMVCAGVVGVKMPRYCLFGDTVNTASRMESNGEPLRIHVSQECKRVLDTFEMFVLTERGHVEMKGKGVQTTYWLHGTKDKIVDPLP